MKLSVFLKNLKKNNMKNNILLATLVVLVVGILGFTILRPTPNVQREVATVFKSPNCGCCGVYVSYMERRGYDIRVEDTEDMMLIKDRFGVPEELGSCHSTEVGRYIVEGHIPEEAIQKLLAERPDIKGIGMAGMPSGSPGMPGPKVENFVIYQITHEGKKGDVFMSI